MRWIDTLLKRNVKRSQQQSARLNAWLALPAQKSHPLNGSRFVIVDVETSGLNLAKDHLIAIGAVAVVDGKLDLEDSFEMVLQQTSSSSKQNILIHGIGGDTQIEGQTPAEVLLAFLDYLRKDPLVAFHVTFDETMLSRAFKQHLGHSLKHEWLDLAYLAPGLYPEPGKRLRALDDWLHFFNIQNYARHSALADAVSTAQLFLIACHTALQRNITDYPALQQLDKAQRWLKH